VVFFGGLYSQAQAPHEHYKTLAQRSLPTVLMNAAFEDLDFPQVSCDDARAVEQAMGHLISLGHRRIGLLLGQSDHTPSRRKLTAAKRVAAEAGLDLPDSFVEWAQFSLEGGQAGAARLLQHGVTGIICASDPLALGAIRTVRRRRLSVPGDVSVIGYDDSAFMTCTDPPLTTVRQPIEAMGRAAVDLLVGAIAGSHTPHDELLFEPELVVRGSTGPPR
jgi:DNA-binding LacI/PurR family transcriptional regulator